MKNNMIATIVIISLLIHAVYLYYCLGHEINNRKKLDSELKYKNELIKSYDKTVFALRKENKNLKNKSQC